MCYLCLTDATRYNPTAIIDFTALWSRYFKTTGLLNYGKSERL
jgi:hypothetical protein